MGTISGKNKYAALMIGCLSFSLLASPSFAGSSKVRHAAATQKVEIRVVKKTLLLTRGRHVHRILIVRSRGKSGAEPASFAQLQGLRGVVDKLALASSSVLVLDEANSNVLFSKNPDVALPIASITKLMTSLVVLEANQPLDEPIQVVQDDMDTEKRTRSRLATGTILTRGDLLHLALMSSENRAAHTLGRNYPGGLQAFVRAMNTKAQLLGMTSAHFVDPTGLSSQNVASAEDLSKLVIAASRNPTIRMYSTSNGYSVPVGKRLVSYRNTNALVSSPAWDIVVQKTGYIAEAGKCLVMKATIEGRTVVIVLLDSVGKYTRLADANRIKKWMETRAG